MRAIRIACKQDPTARHLNFRISAAVGARTRRIIQGETFQDGAVLDCGGKAKRRHRFSLHISRFRVKYAGSEENRAPKNAILEG
ncbi:MAG TPA: hypothetical protein PLU30_18545, partial [Verrucomicrobiae bacterium]|nr:hypothetical protein [Verrucomicrobiae bacterium]